MLQLSTVLAGLATVLLTLTMPLSIPLGTSGKSLSVGEDGQSITLGGKTINLHQAMNSDVACAPMQAGPGTKKKGGGKGKGRGAAISTNAKTIYFITNAAENSIVALKVAMDGSLSEGSVTPTGGAGMTRVDDKGDPVIPDSLFSQGAVKVSGNHIVSVNPGSNTISMFAISATDSTVLTMVGKPADTLGEFPVSVGLSASLSQACVANSGAKVGVTYFTMCPIVGLMPLDTCRRPFELNQTTPPVGPLNTVSQVFFNADSTKLMTIVKGDPTKNSTCFLSVFPVENKLVSTKETRSSPDGTAVLFGAALLPNSNEIFVTDASFGAATLSRSDTNTASTLKSTKVLDQKATCWAAFSELTGTTFVTDVAANHLVEIDPTSGDIVKDLELTNGNPGLIDLVSARRFIYVLSPGNTTVGSAAAVTVFDVSGGRGSC
ncbi:uncharacterized protein RSE6_12125 [Rhynchosporium secalis]|uniref:3-carboxymuconate cyclase n=1 Tax=Rhynchosporium secalis TaxID=38038 RepID=A0A1E1MPM5_RHYSE|nr:uncharacterized protein RSE6_12125 [Rhynchosporium secalis]